LISNKAFKKLAFNTALLVVWFSPCLQKVSFQLYCIWFLSTNHLSANLRKWRFNTK
jgi:NRPS condensation-like uncharacterized protein